MKQRIVQYSNEFKWLHWGIAFIVLSLLSVSFFLEDFSATLKPTAIMLHKSFGLTVLILMLIRLVWVIRTDRPALPKAMPYWEMLLARLVQAAMYLGLIAMACIGWLMSTWANRAPCYFGLFHLPIPGLSPNQAWAHWCFQAHYILAWILVGLISLHVVGALKHALIDRDKVMESMLP